MNRLVLIGNGFDLAHGMKTSYAHFILAHVRQAFQTSKETGYYEDALMTTQKVSSYYGDEPESMTTLKDFNVLPEGPQIHTHRFSSLWRI